MTEIKFIDKTKTFEVKVDIMKEQIHICSAYKDGTYMSFHVGHTENLVAILEHAKFVYDACNEKLKKVKAEL